MRDGDELLLLVANLIRTRVDVALGEFDHVDEELLRRLDRACERMSIATLDAIDRKYEKEKR